MPTRRCCCGCCSNVENICEKLVDAISLYSAEPCLAAFTGSWGTFDAACVSPAQCTNDCRWCSASFLPGSHPDFECTVSSVLYAAEELYIEVLGYTGSSDVWVRVILFWNDDFGEPLARLAGSFYSSDGGTTFGAFQKDTAPPGCGSISISISPPSDGDDLVCTLTLV